MNIYDFLRSPDVAAHCEKIGHEFNPLEMAVIISLSKITIKEKHEAWWKIIADYHDMPIHKSINFPARDSLHDYLREFIEWEENALAEFYKPGDGIVYRNSECYGCYSTFEKARDAIFEDLSGCEADKITRAVIYKDIVDGDYGMCEVWLNSDGEPVSLYAPIPENLDELSYIYIHIPLPFEKGDLVSFVGDDEPYVLRSLPHWSPNERVPYEKFISGEIGDGGDMMAWVYCLDDDGNLTWNDSPCYTYDLKYYNGEFKGHNRFLKYLSDFIKTNSDRYYDLFYAFNKIKAETEAENSSYLIDGNYRYWKDEIEREEKNI